MCIGDDSSSVNVNDESWSVYLSTVQFVSLVKVNIRFVSLVFKMLATEIVSVGIELIGLALAEECRKILENRKKRRPRRWWVKPWIGRREQLGASTQLLVELLQKILIATGII
jgi:hypothetical protein